MEISVKPTLLVIAVALVLAPAAGFAHGQAPQAAHGGRVQDAHGSWVEFVDKGDQVEIYVTDEHGDPIPASRISYQPPYPMTVFELGETRGQPIATLVML